MSMNASSGPSRLLHGGGEGGHVRRGAAEHGRGRAARPQAPEPAAPVSPHDEKVGFRPPRPSARSATRPHRCGDASPRARRARPRPSPAPPPGRAGAPPPRADAERAARARPSSPSAWTPTTAADAFRHGSSVCRPVAVSLTATRRAARPDAGVSPGVQGKTGFAPSARAPLGGRSRRPRASESRQRSPAARYAAGASRHRD